jgi:hypothetical protein
MNCIGCKKKLKKGEFVVLNGGAMIRTKTGATMGDKRHLGFLLVNNHFDSKKNYQSLSIVDQSPNGQFEFYACSHKCLANFLTRQIMLIEKITRIKKFYTASFTKLSKIGEEWGQKVVAIMGIKGGAYLTDESTVYDFFGSWGNKENKNTFIKKISKKLGFLVKDDDYIWQLAKKLKEKKLQK